MTTLFEIPETKKPPEILILTPPTPEKRKKPAINYKQQVITEPLIFGKRPGEKHGSAHAASAKRLL